MKMNTKLLTAGLIVGFLTTGLNAKGMQSPQKIFTKKCQMCHAMSKPKNKHEKMRMAAPPMAVAMRGVVIGVDAIEDPANEKELRTLSIEFLKDYLMNPTRDKGYCEDMSYRKFGMMPSLKGFVNKKQLDIVVPWVFDNFAPKKDANGKYAVSSKKK